MTIVASNSLTVSNINDGTITHTAWSYSADGTNGFTTVYPNLNLLTGTTFKNYTPKIQQYLSMVIKNGGVNNEPYVSISYNNPTANSYTDTISWGFDKEYFKPSTTYTFSFYLKGNGTIRTFVYPSLIDYSSANALADGKVIRPNNDGNYDWSLTSEWVRHTYTFTSKSSLTARHNFLFRIFTGNSVDICLPKVEPGSVATPHMPSSSEVTTADWPSYIGQYSDFTSTASTDPTKYAPWTVFKGNDGKDGVNGKDGIAGKDGVGIKTTVITYAISTNGATAPATGWTSSVPSLIKGQYLWTKTVWTYTDNSFETGYSVTYIAKDGNNGTNGIAGKDGTGIKATTITYAGSTSGTTAPTSGWTSTVPTVAAGSYLWTKTLWTYTDNTSETGYSVAKMGNNGTPGPQGPAGSNGDPGKIVSDTEPSTRFKGLTWKYLGTSDLTASDGTVILSGTEYYWSGTNWILSEINAHNINGNNLKITDGEFVSRTTNGPVTTSTEIKDNHIAISKTDGTVNTRNDIALDSEQGLAQKFTNINTGFYRTAGINYQGPFTSDSDGNYAQLTPQGTKLSTDVPWTKFSLMNNFTGNIEYAIINGTVYISASGVGVPAMTAGQWKQAAQLPTGSSAIPIRANRIAAGDSGDGLSWALLSNQAGGIFIRCSANKAPTPNLFNATLPYPIG